MSRRSEISTERLVAYLESQVTVDEKLEIDQRLQDDTSCRRCLAELEHITNSLAETDELLVNVDLVADVRRALALPRRSRWRAVTWLGLASAMVAAAFVLVVLVPQDSKDGDGIRAKSAGLPGEQADRWVGMQVFRVGEPGQSPEAVGTEIHATDGLLFAYSNLGPQPFAYLMVLAVDEHGQVFWYYPEYSSAHSVPTAVEIRAGATQVELPFEIRHDLKEGSLVLFGVFMHQPMTVPEVEQIVNGLVAHDDWQTGRLLRLPISETGQRRITLRVVP